MGLQRRPIREGSCRKLGRNSMEAERRTAVNEKERLNALKVALDNESREREFYLKNAQRTVNDLGKAMFRQIADDELEHYERLKQLHESWEKQEKWPDTVPLTVKNTAIKDILSNVLKKAEKLPGGDDDDLAAVRTALDFEARGAKFYRELRDAVSDPKEKQFFELLASIENEHYLSLKDTEEFLTDPASWYQEHERHGLDGA